MAKYNSRCLISSCSLLGGKVLGLVLRTEIELWALEPLGKSLELRAGIEGVAGADSDGLIQLVIFFNTGVAAAEEEATFDVSVVGVNSLEKKVKALDKGELEVRGLGVVEE
jgi:hypothetical protein